VEKKKVEIGKGRSKQMWRLEYGKARAVEIEMWRSQSKEKERKGRKDVSKSGMKMVLRIGGDSEWGGENCLKWNGISSLLKIGGRMLRYGFCPIFINEKMRKSAGECQ